MHPAGDLQVTFVNNSASRYFVDESEGCDSCNIYSDAKNYCQNNYPDHCFPKVIMPGQSVVLETKFKFVMKAIAINADSLDKFCGNTNEGITNKCTWVKIFHNDHLATTNKTCTFIIK
ncbi:hypothetical protein CJD36_017410 [Flavipsychrobacter stenotrophus]|uniref:Uncharacterized protein n=1 Tax=Flavipsychrobacter stenotrophus TaxID=2077091 RepID=A0A2S7SS19_9BACT|nr:hypothetical protein CJD36_017410 [Flavipsychrobacter stenotrophus]